ncbi:MAG TPA: DAK2 domain-containing protein [Thermomicrobiales bacterium]|jgi:hypothetical protein|nr:DAK2 domain-containing protein [Thermomicrobiales bacterium]
MTDGRESLNGVIPGSGPGAIGAAPVDARPDGDQWTGAGLLAAIQLASADLARERQTVNALNVFPVPDGDTGTNMDLTMNAAITEAAPLADDPEVAAGEVARRLARGALLGARGNSGVILSQILRGLAQGLEGRAVVSARDLARALASASEMAYGAVLKPVEGTMLTVIRAASEGAVRADDTIPDVLAGALAAAQEALDRTPEQLDLLRQAGVVDAGGQGVVILIRGLERASRGEKGRPPAIDARPARLDATFADATDDAHGEDAWGYCTNFVVLGQNLDVARARVELAAMGSSAVIVGDDTILKVHIHMANPSQALDYGLRLGELTNIRIDNMEIQTRELREQRADRTAGETLPRRPSGGIGRQVVLAVAAGAGLTEALLSMGAERVIDGGETMNPSTAQILEAIEATDAAEVILLPNHPNVIMAANQVRELTERAVRVVPTRSVTQGIAALSSYNADGGLDANAKAMTDAMSHVHTLQVTRASRNAEINGVQVREGQAIVLVDGDLTGASDDAAGLVLGTLGDDRFADVELITVYTGVNATPQHTDGLRALLAERFPDAELEFHDGGQPTYSYVISLE